MINKTSRQLVIFHIFLCSTCVEISDITRLIRTSRKTFARDLKDLSDAGLLKIRFSKKQNGFVHSDDKNRCPFSPPILTNNQSRNRHLLKLDRLVAIMIELRGHTEIPCYECEDLNQETCSTWYKKRFPELNRKTMQRDFSELNKIGYEIKYDRFDKCYVVDFPEGLDGIESRLGTSD